MSRFPGAVPVAPTQTVRPSRFPGAVPTTPATPSRFPGAVPAAGQRTSRFSGAVPSDRYEPKTLRDFIGKAAEGMTPEQAIAEGHVGRFVDFLEKKSQSLPLDSDERERMTAAIGGLKRDVSAYDRRRMAQGITRATSQNLVGQTLQRAGVGLEDAATAGLSLLDRAAESVGLDTPFDTRTLHANKQARDEFLAAAEQGGDVQRLLGERGANIYNSVVESVAKFGAVGNVGGTAAVYSLMGGESFDNGLQEAAQAGLEGNDAVAYASKKAATEVAITALMGQVGKRFGLASFEESLSPAMRAAASRLASPSGAAGALRKTAATAGGAGLEATEEMLVDAVQQAVELDAGVSDRFSWRRLQDAGIAGAAARGGTAVPGAIRNLTPSKLGDIVSGTVAADKAAAAGTDLSAIGENLTQKAFAAYTGIRKTSKVFRDAFAAAVGVNSGTPAESSERAPESPPPAIEAVDPVSTSQESEGSETASEGLTEADTPQEGEEGPPADEILRQTKGLAEWSFSPQRKVVDQARNELALPRLPDAEQRGWQQELDTAKQNHVPDRALAIATDLIANPRALSPVETAGVAIKAAEIKQRYERQAKSLAEAEDTTDTRLLAAEVNRAQEEFDTLSQALRLSGSEKGRALASQKLTINQTFDLLSIRSRVKAAKGAALTPEQEAETVRVKQEIDEAEADVKRSRKKVERARERKNRLEREHRESRTADPENVEQTEKLAEQLDGAESVLDGREKQQDKVEFKLRRARAKVSDLVRNARPKTVWNSVTGAQDFARAVMTSFDFSGMMRQGGMLVFANPQLAPGATRAMFRAARSTYEADKIAREIEQRPNAELYAKADLFLHDVGGKPIEREETFASRLADRIPGVGGSQRAYVTFLNRIRADSFDALIATLAKDGEPTIDEAKAIANFVNVASGRGNAGSWSPAMQNLSSVFFAPRYVLSRFQAIAFQPLWRGNARTRTLIAEQYGKYMVGMGLIYALSAAAWGDEEDFSLTFDPRSADFGKIRLGDTRLDPLSGFAQTIRIVAQLATGQTMNRHGEIRDLRGPNAQFGANLFDTATRFGRTKLAPGPSLLVDAIVGENVVGEEFDGVTAVRDRFTPLTVRDVTKAIEDQGVTRGVALGLLSLFGVGLQVYDSDS